MRPADCSVNAVFGSGQAYTGGGTAEASWMDRFSTPEVLHEGELDNLIRWSNLVDEHYDQSIEIAVRRGLSAVAKRSNTEDSLIDAVIAMESLFGHSGETEVGFRVTSAISILLEPNPAARATFRSRLGKVYGSRSKVVHGSSTPHLHDHKEEAIGVMVRCLRALFEETPHLITDRDRGMRLILRNEAA